MANSQIVLNGYKGLGTFFWVELFLHEHENHINLDTLRLRLEQEITTFDNNYSRFKHDSILNTLNRNHTLPYDHHLAMMITHGEEASKVTGGVFSIYIKDALEEKGYGVPESAMYHDNSRIKETSTVVIDNKTITLLGSKGIDLGGVGKGYLIDEIARILREEFDLHYFVINGGGDIYATSNHGKKIELYLEHPITAGEHIGKIHVQDTAFCSSSSFKRRWTKDDKEVNHFIANKEIWAASYVLAPSATIADIYATVCCIESDNDQALHNLKEKTNIKYVVITGKAIKKISTGFPTISDE